MGLKVGCYFLRLESATAATVMMMMTTTTATVMRVQSVGEMPGGVCPGVLVTVGLPETFGLLEIPGPDAAPTAMDVSALEPQYELLPWKVAPMVYKPALEGVHAYE